MNQVIAMSPSSLRLSGVVCLATGLVGALAAVVLLAWPTSVDEDLLRYPFSEAGFLVAQAFFAVHHLGLVAGVVALALCGAVGTSRLARVGAWLLVAGTVGLTLAEVNTMRYADWTNDAANAGLMGASYGITCTVMGIGAILAGVGVLRTRLWGGWRAWTPMAIGIAQFVVLTPGMFGGFVTARLAIGTWMLLFAALGWSVYVGARGRVTDRVEPALATG